MKVLSAYWEKLEKEKPNGRCKKWRLYVRTDEGKRSRRFTGDYRDMLKALDAFKAEVESEVRNSETFAAYAERWLKYRVASGQYEVGTLKNDRQYVNMLSRQFGNMRLDEITPETCRDGMVNMKSGGEKVLSGTYMNKVYTTFHAIMRQAYDDGRIPRDPLVRVQPPKRDTKEKSWLSPDQLRNFIERLGEMELDGRVVCCYLIAYLGLRRGEACALMVEDVDLDGGMAHIRHAVKENSGRVDGTKTSAGMRDLPMPDSLVCVLRGWLETRTSPDSKFVACSSSGTVLRPQNLYKWWLKNRDFLGADGMGLHQIRHSNLSMMARHMSVFDLQRWAGWSSIEPAKIYVHADAESLRVGSSEAFLHHLGTI